MIEFGTIEITIGKRTINKRHANKITSGKITIDKLTRLKFFKIHFFFAIHGILVKNIKEISGHTIVLVLVGAKLLISVGN
jgi:hypothetical protein